MVETSWLLVKVKPLTSKRQQLKVRPTATVRVMFSVSTECPATEPCSTTFFIAGLKFSTSSALILNQPKLGSTSQTLLFVISR